MLVSPNGARLGTDPRQRVREGLSAHGADDHGGRSGDGEVDRAESVDPDGMLAGTGAKLRHVKLRTAATRAGGG